MHFISSSKVRALHLSFTLLLFAARRITYQMYFKPRFNSSLPHHRPTTASIPSSSKKSHESSFRTNQSPLNKTLPPLLHITHLPPPQPLIPRPRRPRRIPPLPKYIYLTGRIIRELGVAPFPLEVQPVCWWGVGGERGEGSGGWSGGGGVGEGVEVGVESGVPERAGGGLVGEGDAGEGEAGDYG